MYNNDNVQSIILKKKVSSEIKKLEDIVIEEEEKKCKNNRLSRRLLIITINNNNSTNNNNNISKVSNLKHIPRGSCCFDPDVVLVVVPVVVVLPEVLPPELDGKPCSSSRDAIDDAERNKFKYWVNKRLHVAFNDCTHSSAGVASASIRSILFIYDVYYC